MTPVMMKGNIVSVATMALGRTWRNMMRVFDTPSAFAARIYSKVPRPQEFSTHHADQPCPAKQGYQEHQ